MTVTGRKHNADDIIATVLAVEPMRFIYRGRIAVFSIRVLRDERICVIAEQRPECSEEEVIKNCKTKKDSPATKCWGWQNVKKTQFPLFLQQNFKQNNISKIGQKPFPGTPQKLGLRLKCTPFILQSFQWMSRVLQAVDSIHQVGIYCLALVPPNYLPKTPLGGIHLSETKRRYLEGTLHPANVLLCPHTCVTNLPKPREIHPGKFLTLNC